MEAAAAAQVTAKGPPTLALLAQPTEDKEEHATLTLTLTPNPNPNP